MKKSIFAFLTALLVVTGCMGCIGHIGNIRYRGDMENPGDVKTPEDMENLENMETSGDVETLEDMETLENTGPSAGFPGLLTITARAAGTAGTLLVVSAQITRPVRPHPMQNNVPFNTTTTIPRSFS